MSVMKSKEPIIMMELFLGDFQGNDTKPDMGNLESPRIPPVLVH